MKARFLRNLFANTLGIGRILFYRTFIERKWRTYQPMLNIITVQEDRQDIFKEFLRKSLKLSKKFDTPISFGAYKVSDAPTYIYITHYASTFAYMKVMTGILLTGLAIKRARATVFNNWTYCKPDAQLSPQMEKIMLVGVQGNPERFTAYLNQNGVIIKKKIKQIKTIRDTSLASYFVLEDTKKNDDLLEPFLIDDAGSIQIYKAALIPDAERTPVVP